MKNLDKKQAVLCHRKPLGRQRTRQRYLPQCIIGFLLLLISIAIQAQIPQELIDKARAAGMTEEQIQREIAKPVSTKSLSLLQKIPYPTVPILLSKHFSH